MRVARRCLTVAMTREAPLAGRVALITGGSRGIGRAVAQGMAEAGADQLVAHVGLTTAGTVGAGVAVSLDEAIERVLAIAAAGHQARDDIIVICHGGPFDEPENVGTALARMPGVAGFFGASSIERLPTERAIREQVRDFKSLTLA